MVDCYEALERLSKLKADGVLTEDEFAAEKAKLLSEPGDAAPPPPTSGPAGSRRRGWRALWLVLLALIAIAILIAISAARTFGGNLFLGAVIGMIMIHTDLLNAWSVAGMDPADIPTASAWFGLYDINLVGYQGHVIPVVIAVWLMSALEKKLHKIVPEIIDLAQRIFGEEPAHDSSGGRNSGHPGTDATRGVGA